MLTLYFSGTGNTKHIAELFSQKMNAACFSIESAADFSAEIKQHDMIAFCYPIYGSRAPRIMREFVCGHISGLAGKKIIIFVTQMMFSGDGARAFTDLFEEGAIEVIYAEHFNMQQNIGNTPILNLFSEPTAKSKRKYLRRAEAKMDTVCGNIRNGIVKKRGFSIVSRLLGCIQGKPWLRLEKSLKSAVRIHEDCTVCGVCVQICPMKNLVSIDGRLRHLNNCTVCYRCVNRCPQKAVTVFIHRKPRWQYTLQKETVT